MDEREQVRELSEQLVALQRPIRVLDAVSWTDEVEAEFHRHRGEREPAAVTAGTATGSGSGPGDPAGPETETVV